MRDTLRVLTVAMALGCGASSTRDGGVDAARDPRDSGYPSVCGMTLGTCNWVSNQGCDGGLGCYRASVDGGVRQLCATPGGGGWGAMCTRANDCQPGFACLGEPGRCTLLCCGADHGRCGDVARGGREGALCVGAVLGTDSRYCIETEVCDPLATAGNGCPSDRPRCDVVSSSGTTACGTVRGTPGGDGAACCRSESCAPGFACIRDLSTTCADSAPNGVCRRFCAPSTDAGSTCPAGQGCTLRFEDLPATLGACAPPR